MIRRNIKEEIDLEIAKARAQREKEAKAQARSTYIKEEIDLEIAKARAQGEEAARKQAQAQAQSTSSQAARPSSTKVRPYDIDEVKGPSPFEEWMDGKQGDELRWLDRPITANDAVIIATIATCVGVFISRRAAWRASWGPWFLQSQYPPGIVGFADGIKYLLWDVVGLDDGAMRIGA